MMRTERYLVSVTKGDQEWSPTRKMIWEGEGSLALDHSRSWKLERVAGPVSTGLRFRLKDQVRDIEHLDEPFSLPIGTSGEELKVSLRLAPALTPAYLSKFEPTAKADPAVTELRVSFGAKQSLAAFQSLTKKYVGKCGREKLFVLSKTRDGYKLKARTPGLTILRKGSEPVVLKKKEVRLLSQADLESSTLTHSLNWWRFSRVAVRSLVHVPEQLEPSPLDIEKLWFKQLNKKLAIGCAVFTVAILCLPHFKSDNADHELEKPLPPTTLISLKKPKVIEKVVSAPAPAAAPMAKPVAQAPVAPPKKKESHKSHPKMTAKVTPPPPPVPVAPKVDEAALRAKQQAVAKNNLAKSLNFLSTAPQLKTSAVTSNRADARYKTMNQASPVAQGSSEALTKLAKSAPNDGPIQTSGAREIDTRIAVGGGHGKALNDVQGRVSLNSIATGGSGAGADGLLSGKGLSVSGDGSLSESEIEKALSKHLQRFQYCYEKALLSDSSLAGNVMMQWTIGGDGRASSISVVRSQLNNAQLHQCLTSELSKVHFSAPQGGSVIVKYPFAFSSTPF